jgi:hypothetical protein
MAVVSPAPSQHQGFGNTQRRDPWYAGPILTVIGFSAFLVYGTWASYQDGNFEIRATPGGYDTFHKNGNHAVAPYLSPFYSPLIYDNHSHHAWIAGDMRDWAPSWLDSVKRYLPISAGFLILAFPGLFRFTCYYYRKAYYRAFVGDPPGCAVGELWKNYKGENTFPMILQNAHRYAMYIACVFLVLLWWDAIQAFVKWGKLPDGSVGGWGLGIGVGSLIMLVNVICLSAFTFGCNSVRHLVGGRKDCFTCPNNVSKTTSWYQFWRWSTWFNERHMEWAWISLFTVGFTDIYIRLCSLGVIRDWNTNLM